MMASPFRVPRGMLAEIATGGGGREAIQLLVRVRRSRTLLLISELLRETRAMGHPQAPIAAAAAAELSRIAAAAPSAVNTVLDHPSIGTWARHQALLVRGDAALARPGDLAAVVVASAVRARIAVTLPVAVSGPAFSLPSLGWADLGSSGSEVAVRPGPGGVELERGGIRAHVPDDPATDGERWHGLPRLEAGPVRLLLDPWQHVHLPPLLRASAAAGWPPAHAQWRDRIAAGVDILAERHPEVAAELAAAITVLTPLGADSGPTSVTLADGFGCIFLSLPPDGRTAAETLTHELQHGKLSALLDLFPLLAGDPTELFYAPWRPDPRPLLGVLHGTYAHLGVTAFWRRERQTKAHRADIEFARWRSVTLTTAETLLARADLTALGRDFVDNIAAQLRVWADEPIPAAALAVAAAQADEHRHAWLAAAHLPG
jgi:HEXXH motif-containing protein